MLISSPVVSKGAKRKWEELGPMTMEAFEKVASKIAPIDINAKSVIFHTWEEENQSHAGTVLKKDHVPHGIVRSIMANQTIIEYQVDNGQKHGFERTIGTYGFYETRNYRYGKVHGEFAFYNPDGSLEHRYSVYL